MAKTLNEVAEQKAVAEIVHFGEKLILPTGMKLDVAIDLLNRRKQYEGQKVNMSETFEVFPWDGAFALQTVLERKFGWAQAIGTPGFFGENPPSLISIEVGPGQTKQVPWGAFSVPGVEGKLASSVGYKDGRAVFQLIASVYRRDEPTIRELFAELRKECATNSIYRGKALRIRFRDDDGDVIELPEPRFIDTSLVNDSLAVYPDHVAQAIRTNLFTPIVRARDCIENGIPLKRGVLLAGTFGTGKTLAATVASKLAVEAGITYLYIPHADELPEAIQFAKQYQSPACVIFCEDIDRTTSGARSVAMDDILNTIDGIDTKTSNIIVVLTTNDLESINPAMLRPGRLDAVIEVTPPDAKAVERLIRLYGGKAIDPNTDLSAAGAALAGNIPAVVAEVVKRAKLAQLAIQQPGTLVSSLTEQAIIEAAKSIRAQVDLLNKCSQPKEAEPSLDRAMRNIVGLRAVA